VRHKKTHDRVAREKEALRNWQMAKQHEMLRISEVIELCAKQPVSAPRTAAPSASASPAEPQVSGSAQPGLASKASTGR
jgi:hypothetical protein